MFVSLNSSLTRQMEWKDFVPLAARLGYGGVDVDLTAARQGGAAATRALLAGLKIKPGVASLPVRYTNPDASVSLEDLKQLEDAAKVRRRDRLSAHDGRTAAVQPDAEGGVSEDPQGSD